MMSPSAFPLSLPLRWEALLAGRREAARESAGAPPRPRAEAHAGAAADEAARIRLAQRGDADAFRLLVEAHADAVFETALRIVRSREEAEEAAQDAFVRAWRALEGFRGDARFSTWLYRIAARCALDRAVKARKRRERETPADAERIEQAPAPERPDTDRRRLERALGKLTAVQRAVVTLYYLRDRPVDEVAEILDLPTGTVKTHLHRARGALRRHWGTE
ncbi:MAG TPA: sigma-70 family RNA polymerase sigma factor [bacterium]|nr:sigma-70 family RNA polymerase sigma factor [bacterium]